MIAKEISCLSFQNHTFTLSNMSPNKFAKFYLQKEEF